MRLKHASGFTLIEVLIAVAVLGILVAVALPSYQNYIARGEVDRCLKLITPATMTADNLILNNNGDATAIDAVALGIATASNCDAVAVNNTTANGDIDISGTVNTGAGNNTMRWRRAAANGIWTCTSTGNTGLAPTTCP
ncbi:MAG: pilin [Pseudomonadota bacterium]